MKEKVTVCGRGESSAEGDGSGLQSALVSQFFSVCFTLRGHLLDCSHLVMPSWTFNLKLSSMDPQSVIHPNFLPPHRGPAGRSLLTWKWGRWALSLECACPQCQLEFLSWDVDSSLCALSCVITCTDLICLTRQAAYCLRVWAAWILVTLDPFSSKEMTKVMGVIFTFSFSFNELLLWSSGVSYCKKKKIKKQWKNI